MAESSAIIRLFVFDGMEVDESDDEVRKQVESVEMFEQLHKAQRRHRLSQIVGTLELNEWPAGSRESHIRVANYYTDVCVRKSDSDFKADYRICRSTFLSLCQLLAPDLLKTHSGRPRYVA